MNVRLSMIAISLALAGCAATPQAPPAIAIPAAAIPDVAPHPAPPAGCEALVKSYDPLIRLKSMSSVARINVMEPTRPERLSSELADIASVARAARTEDAEMATLVDDMAVRFSTMADRLHDFTEAKAASSWESARAALDAVLLAATSSEAFLAASHRRCDVSGKAKPVAGRLPPPVIQGIVRARFSELRVCYEAGLRRNPALDGRVLVRFVIDHEGHVSSAKEGADSTESAFEWNLASDPAKPAPEIKSMPDPRVVSCVLAAFRTMTFPKPEGGIVTVTYPIMFAPGG